MLQITIPAVELWDERTERFIHTLEQTLQLEHSLVSLSKWESKWHKPFYSNQEKSFEETVDYIRCMTLTEDVDPESYRYITNQNVQEINRYIDDSMTATTFSEDKRSKASREVITAEIIYYWMIALNIPMECENWHLNRLITCLLYTSPSPRD